jgi:hypothetical protein
MEWILGVRIMVFNATFNNNSDILTEETGVHVENLRQSLVRYYKLQLTVSDYLFGIFKSFLGQAQISWYLV